MAFNRIRLLAMAAVAALAPAAWAGAPPRPIAEDARKTAARIDGWIAAGYARAGVRPAAPADAAAFLRRASLDVVGKIPPVADVRRFLSDKSPDKHSRAMEALLDSPGYANHFTEVWRHLLLPEADNDLNRRFLAPGLERWLHKQFADNVPYDKWVRELLTTPLNGNQQEFFQIYNGRSQYPLSFYMAKEGKPEELAAATARLFLGVRLECAQCHDHPFGKWTREQFWSQAAFFAGIRRPRNQEFFFAPLGEVNDRRELAIPNTDRVAQARFLDDKEPRWKYKVGARTTLADWMTAPGNPFFARAIVNRTWAHFFGVGLVDPPDDFRDDNPPSHPELLDELARQLVAHKFDLQFLIRAITLSNTYRLGSEAGPDASPLRLFARMPVKGLTAEQLFDSLCQATGFRDPTPRQQRAFRFDSPRQKFLDAFAVQEKATESLTSIPQALKLMNGEIVNQATHPDKSVVLAAIASSSFMSTAGQVEALYLAALSRKPRPDEALRHVRYVESGGAAKDRKKALADVFWVLLNSTEFVLNH
jgi:hypothetical protein